MANENDKRYVLRDEWRDSREQMLNKINDNDRKHSEAIKDLKSEIEQGNIYSKQSYDVQKEMGQDIKALATEMKSFGSEVTDIKYTVKSHDDKIKGIQGTIDEKQKGSVQIIVAIIGVSGVIITAAAAFLQNLF